MVNSKIPGAQKKLQIHDSLYLRITLNLNIFFLEKMDI